jgi:hypothetical protein
MGHAPYDDMKACSPILNLPRPRDVTVIPLRGYEGAFEKIEA